MKTRADLLEGDSYDALKQAMEFLQSKGYEAKLYTDFNGDDTLRVIVDDDGEEVQYVCTWEYNVREQ